MRERAANDSSRVGAAAYLGRNDRRLSSRCTVKTIIAAIISILIGLEVLPSTVRAQVKPAQVPQQGGRVVYESIAPGVVKAHVFATSELRDAKIEVEDLILGPGKSATDVPLQGVGIMELRSGEVETSIDGQVMRRRPGDHWVVKAGQRYSIKNLAGQAVIQGFIIMNRKK